MQNPIVYVKVYLDEVPEYMAGILRCESVISEDSEGNETDHQELIDNAEFHSEEALIASVAKRLKVSNEIVHITD